ncbi:hypothetical protein [Brevibacillus parabrevis]|nr:hypothetical protein [Brevibacillus parabrevis]
MSCWIGGRTEPSIRIALALGYVTLQVVVDSVDLDVPAKLRG